MLAALAYHERDVDEELGLFDLSRRQTARILGASSPGAWGRVGIVGDRGERTIAQMVNGAVEHLAHHLRFIAEKRGALGFGEATGPGPATGHPRPEAVHDRVIPASASRASFSSRSRPTSSI